MRGQEETLLPLVNGLASRPPLFLLASVQLISVGDYRNFQFHHSCPHEISSFTVATNAIAPRHLISSS